jgi:hypothetical protein
MICWTPTTPPLAPRRWQSRAEILKAHLGSLSPLELLRVRPDLYALTWGWDFENKRYASGRFALYEEMERRGGFNPNQPRVPAGNPDGGQWTSEGGGGGLNDSRVISDAMPPNDWVPGAQYAAGPRGPKDRLPLPHAPMPGVEGVGSTYRPGQVTIVNNAQTGLSTVDETTDKLRKILEKVVNSRGEGYGPEYGKAIHYDFGDAVKDAIRSENLSGNIRVEHTYPEGDEWWYSKKGTIRTDVVLRNDGGEVTAIYDVKTGSAYLDANRVQELRTKTGAGPEIPVIEMHIQRGLSLKSRAARAKYFWLITLRLWNPWIRDIPGREANRRPSSWR